jgi:hypothetical protein
LQEAQNWIGRLDDEHHELAHTLAAYVDEFKLNLLADITQPPLTTT